MACLRHQVAGLRTPIDLCRRIISLLALSRCCAPGALAAFVASIRCGCLYRREDPHSIPAHLIPLAACSRSTRFSFSRFSRRCFEHTHKNKSAVRIGAAHRSLSRSTAHQASAFSGQWRGTRKNAAANSLYQHRVNITCALYALFSSLVRTVHSPLPRLTTPATGQTLARRHAASTKAFVGALRANVTFL